MKTKLLIALCVLTMTFGNVNFSRASENDPLDIAGDIAIVRPGCFLATVAGSAIFVVALPFAALSKSVKKTAHTLVVKPAKATFTRPLGDFTDLLD
jgi:hypothetical protein